MPALSEEKTATCAWCPNVFEKTRHDQRFCSPECCRRLHNHETWLRRPDKEKQKKRRLERYYANREESLRKQREYRQQHKESVRASDRAKYQRTKEKRLQQAKAYRALHPEIRQAEHKKSRQRFPWKAPLSNARNRSLKKGFSFDLTREWCQKTWTGRCAVTNLPFVLGTQTHYPFSPSIDRIDSTQGYLQTNCRFVLFAVNSFKGNGSDADMLLIARALIDQKAAPPMP